MSVTTRTNLIPNPSAETGTSGFAANAGTGGVVSTSRGTNGGWSRSGYYRATWTTASTASGYIEVSGLSASGITAGQVYTFSAYLRSSVATTMYLRANWWNGSTSTGTATGSNVALAANTWTQVTLVGVTAPAGTVGVWLDWYCTSAQALNQTIDIDAVLAEQSATLGSYFDGSFTNGNCVVYAWTAGADASTSTAKTYQPVIVLTTPGTTPSPYIQVTIQDLDPNTDVVNIWRTVDGKRRAVRGGRHRSVVGSDFVNDYEAPLGRSTAYDLEILSGVCAGASVTTQSTTITGQACGWLSDPMFPGSAVPVYADVGPNGEPGLDFDALQKLDYVSAVSEFIVAGQDEPVALIGQRQAAANVPVNVTTLATAQSNALRSLIKQAAVLLFRPLPGWASALPGLLYVGAATITELPLELYGGQMVGWQIPATVYAPPASSIVVPTTTYGTVSGSYATYADFNNAHAGLGQTYLDVLKNP